MKPRLKGSHTRHLDPRLIFVIDEAENLPPEMYDLLHELVGPAGVARSKGPPGWLRKYIHPNIEKYIHPNIEK